MDEMNVITIQRERDLRSFWAKVSKGTGRSACWVWTASTIEGYGQFRNARLAGWPRAVSRGSWRHIP